MGKHEAPQPTAIAVPGLFGEAGPIVQLLAEAGTHAVGVNAARPWAPHLKDWSLDIATALWVDCDDAPAPTVVAHSLGAFPALHAAATHPTARVILLNPCTLVPGSLQAAQSLQGRVTVLAATHDVVTGLRNEMHDFARAAGASLIRLPHFTHAGFLPGIDQAWHPVVFTAERVANLLRRRSVPLDHGRQRVAVTNVLRRLLLEPVPVAVAS